MVKVIGDGKEYEFKEVKIKEFDSQIDKITNVVSISYPYRTKKIDDDMLIELALIDKEEPKQSFVSVPKEIQFGKDWEEKFCLKIDKHSLRYNLINHYWEFNYNLSIEHVDCVLVPVKREELKEGDFLYQRIFNSKINNVNAYGLVINNKEFVRVDTNPLNIKVCKFVNYPNDVWFKVVPRSEVEK